MKLIITFLKVSVFTAGLGVLTSAAFATDWPFHVAEPGCTFKWEVSNGETYEERVHSIPGFPFVKSEHFNKQNPEKKDSSNIFTPICGDWCAFADHNQQAFVKFFPLKVGNKFELKKKPDTEPYGEIYVVEEMEMEDLPGIKAFHLQTTIKGRDLPEWWWSEELGWNVKGVYQGKTRIVTDYVCTAG